MRQNSTMQSSPANTDPRQGGVASVTGIWVDSFDKHINDTMIAGD